jgi:hypothetical protein
MSNFIKQIQAEYMASLQASGQLREEAPALVIGDFVM